MVPEGEAVDEGMEVGDVGVFHSEIVHDKAEMSKLHTETVPAQHNTRHKANVRQADGR